MTEYRHVSELSEDDKEDFLEALMDGLPPDEAARRCGTSGFQFKKLRNPQGHWFDAAFAESFQRIMASEERGRNIRDLIDGYAHKAMAAGNGTLIHKYLLAYHPDFEAQRHMNFRLDGKVDIIHQLAQKFSPEQLDAMIEERRRELDEREPLKALPPPAA